jgi:hypothetical protein
MVLAPERGDHCRCHQGESSYKQRSELSAPISFKRVGDGVIFKSRHSNSSPINSRSTIRPGRVTRTHAFTPINSKSSDILNVDIPRVVTSRSGGRPCAHGEVGSGKGECPAGVEVNDFSPSDRDLFQRIGDHNAFVVESDFRTNQEGVDAGQNCGSHADINRNGGGASLVEARPDKEPTHRHTYSGKEQVGVGAVGIGVVHSRILSQDPSKALHSVKAVR